MNKIKVVENKIIPFDNTQILIDGTFIKFLSNGNYYIEYIDCSNVNLTIEIDRNICINLFEYSNNDSILFNNTYLLNKGSSLILSKFYCNNITNEKLDIYLKGETSNIEYTFSSICNEIDKYLINIHHEDKNTSSNIFNRTIATTNSSTIFDINSYVDNNIKNCNLNQHTKIITLGDSNNKINPNMFINEESTNAVHSSAIGTINEDILFYMMSRGIDYNTCVNLIIKGAILSNISVNMEYKEKILKLLDKIGGE